MAAAIKAANMDPAFRAEVQGLIKAFDFGNCLACGMCTAGCPYSDLIPGHDPRKFLRKVLLGLKEEALKDPYVWYCNMCERCTVECPMQINVATFVRTIRGNFYDRKEFPGFLQKVVEEQIETGNQMAVDQVDYIETLEWLEEELQAELEERRCRPHVRLQRPRNQVLPAGPAGHFKSLLRGRLQLLHQLQEVGRHQSGSFYRY